MDDPRRTPGTDLPEDLHPPLDDAAQERVAALLRAEPDPGPMPAALSDRIERALGRAADQRAADHELFDELGFEEEETAGAHPAYAGPTSRGGGPLEDDGEGDDGAAPVVPLHRRRGPLLVAVAAAVAFIAVIGVVVANGLRGGPENLATVASPGAPGSTDIHVQVSATAYTKDTLVDQARTLVAAPGPDAGVGDAPSAGPLVTQTGAAACVAALGAGDAGSVSIDVATYGGQPAAVVVVRRSDTTTVYAVQRDCGDGDAGIIEDAVPVPSAS